MSAFRKIFQQNMHLSNLFRRTRVFSVAGTRNASQAFGFPFWKLPIDYFLLVLGKKFSITQYSG